MKRSITITLLIFLSISLFAVNPEETELINRTMTITVPSFTLFSDNDVLNKTLDTINNTLYSDSFKLLNGSGEVSNDFRSWDKMVYASEATITCQSEKTASFATKQYIYYYHAAHGMHLLLGYVFDLKTGKKLSLSDLLTGDQYQEKILDFMTNEIKEKDIPIFNFSDFRGIDENTEFFLEKDHIVFVFQEYEYTPYVYGFLTFRIPFDYLKEDLNPEYF